MLEYPAQFVGLWTFGNRILVEPDGFGWKIFQEGEKLRNGPIEVYDHDIRKIRIGTPQAKYNNARLYADESAKEDAVRFAVRDGDWGVDDRRFLVGLNYAPRHSGPDVAGLGFRSEGNQAYFDTSVNQLLVGLEDVTQRVAALRDSLK